MAAVKTGKPQRLVQIAGFLQGTECSFLLAAAMCFAQNLCKSFCQPLFTHEPFFFPCARSRGQAHPVCLPARARGTKAAGILSISRSAKPHWKLISRLCAAAVPAGRSAKAGRRPDTHGFCRSQRLHHKALFSLQTRSPAWHDTARSVSRARQARVPATGREKCDLPGCAPFHAMFFLLYGISPDLSAVGGKLMRRRNLFSAPHGFDVNDSIVFIFLVWFSVPYLQLAPAHMGTRQAG